jgi:uncharacterized protein (DUF2252 family)
MKQKLPRIPTPANRALTLAERRNLKMASSAHAFVRGSTVQFYAWLEERGARAVPNGPPVWICGDCHAGNLGPVADADGKIHVQIRDLDQTVIGNPNHDLIRLALSLASAARGSDLPGVTTAHMLEQMMVGYQSALKAPTRVPALASHRPECVRVVVRRAMNRTWKHLARERLKDLKPNIPRGDRFWPLSKQEQLGIEALFKIDDVRQLVTSLKSRSDNSKIEVLDAAYWMKGCSSLGRLRYAVLLNVTNGDGKEDEFCLMDIKEAIPAAAPRARDAVIPRDNARRVVEGAKHLAPALGGRMMAAKFLNRSVVLRELMPQDLKLQIDQLARKDAIEAARFLAEVVGKAHARQMDAKTRAEFHRSLNGRPRSAKLDAPSWLWTSVVELASAHEAAYLEHCRQYALG